MNKDDFIFEYNRKFLKNSKQINCLCDSSNYTELYKFDRYLLISPTVVCKDCGLIYTNPRPKKKTINKFYSSGMYRIFYESINPYDNFEKYLNLDELKKKYEYEYNYSNFIFKKTKKLIGLNDRLIEIGMGGGWNLVPFKNKDRIYGLDLDINLCKLAKNVGIKNVITGDLSKIEVFKTKFKLIILNHVIEHLFDFSSNLKIIKNHLLDNGYLYIGCPLYDHSHNYGEIQNVHNFYFTKNTLLHYLSKNGFKLIYWGKEDRINQYGIFKKNEFLDRLYFYDTKKEYKKVIKLANDFKLSRIKKYRFRNLIKNLIGKSLSNFISKYLHRYRYLKLIIQLKIIGEDKIRRKKIKYKN